MKRFSPMILTFALVTIFVCGVVSHSQESTDPKQYSAPVAWAEYQIPSQKLSFLSPKVPVARSASDSCSEVEVGLYSVYAAGAVYEFEWHAKKNTAMPDWCTSKTKFSKTLLTKRIDELKAENWKYAESKTTVAGLPAIMLRSTNSIGSAIRTRWLIWQKNRWLELGIIRRMDTVVDEARFSGGLKLSSSAGLDVGNGADATYGDSELDLKSDFEGKTRLGIFLVTKPKPAYTEEARQMSLQGTVILRTTFLRNGGIGTVSVVKGLCCGLTEQAIIAARKIAFLPGTVDGKPINVIKQIEYTFSIY